MALKKKNVPATEQKEWANPVDPAMSSDERDKEQLLRQYKEAQRLNENLTEEEQTNKKTK